MKKIIESNNAISAFEKVSSHKDGMVYNYFKELRPEFFIDSRTIYEQGLSSFAFRNYPGEVFGTSSPEFYRAYLEVTSGEGREKEKINTLHSSSLLGLMCFYAVSESNKLKISIPFSGKNIDFEFDKVVFEKTNRVFSPSVGLSSIDIALYGTAKGKRIALYLESKFSEYLHTGNYSGSDKKAQYRPFYDILQPYLKDIKYEIKNSSNGKEDGKLHLNGKHYCEGIKQMVSHLIGAVNSEDNNKVDRIYIAPIIFDFRRENKKGTTFYQVCDNLYSDYKEQYTQLAKGLNALCDKINDKDLFKYAEATKPDQIAVSESILTYQEFFGECFSNGYTLPETVKEFYQL